MSPQHPAITDNLDKEISMLRSMLLDVHEKAMQEDDIKTRLRILDIFSLAVSRLSSILKTHRFLANDRSAANLIDEALAEVIAELEAEGFPKE